MHNTQNWTRPFIKSDSSLTATSNSMGPYSEGASLHNYVREREVTLPRARSRWNPKPEQIRILEDLLESGMENPTTEEIKSIRTQLEIFGEVANNNVYYWFRNRKSRIKRRQRQQEAAHEKTQSREETVIPSSTSSTPTSTSTPAWASAVPVSSFAVYDEKSNSNEFNNMQAKGAAATARGMSNEEPGGVHDSIVNTDPLITVFINGSPMNVPMGPLNLRAFFGDVILFHSSGELVLLNEWGFTVEGLKPGANYFTGNRQPRQKLSWQM